MSENVKYVLQNHMIQRQKESEDQIRRNISENKYTYDAPLVVLNPYIVNPLAALIYFETEKEYPVTITITGKEAKGDIRHTFPKAKCHFLPIVGLYENYENTIEIELYQGPKSQVKIKTEPLPEEYRIVKSVKTTHAVMGDCLIFLTPALTGVTTGVDYMGEIRWLCTMNLYCGFERLKNGHIYVSSDRILKYPYYMSGIYEMDLVGKIYREYMLPGAYHHAVYEMKDGNLLILTEDLESGTVEDMCVLVDRQTGEILKTWDFKDCLKVGDAPSGSWTEEDWFHNNSLCYDENTNSISFSGRHMDAIINIDFDTGKLNWILGEPRGWSEEYKKYFFKPVENADFGWQYEQHAVHVLEDGTVLCFDNGHWRSKVKEEYVLNKDNYSRGVRYKLNLENMTIEQVWEYGKELGQEFFSRYVSNCDYFGENHYLIHSGGIQLYDDVSAEGWVDFSDPRSRVESRTIELLDGEIVLDMTVSGNFYRGKKYPLYYPGANLSMEDGKILGSLAQSGQSPRSEGQLKDGGLIPEENTLYVIEDRDVILVKGRFEVEDQVAIILENDRETRQYTMDYMGPMAAFTGKPYLSLNPKNRSTGINKQGLSGKYEVFIRVNDTKYKTAVYITV